MGLVHRCDVCGTEIVVERSHRGKTIACRRCSAPYEVPQNLDFLTADAESGRDRDHAGRLIVLVVAGGAACCLPISAYVWWAAAGAIHRARDEGRPVEPLLHSTLGVAMVFAILNGLIWVLGLAGFVFQWWP
jgi:hypothetical protein